MALKSFDIRVLTVCVIISTGCSGVMDSGTPTPTPTPNPSTNTPPTSNATLEAGKAFVEKNGCAGCHSSSKGTLAGSSGGLKASNLTPDKKTGLGDWSDAQIVLAIRAGVDDQSSTLCSSMPRFPTMTDAEGVAVVAYLRSLPAVSNSIEGNAKCTVSDADAALHGKLVADDQKCSTCHGAALSGSDKVVPGTKIYGPNLTPDNDTGLGSWSEDVISKAITMGTDDEGKMLCSTMPRFSTLNDDEVTGLVKYLKNLTAVSHESPDGECGDDAEHPDDAGSTNPDDAGTTQADAGVLDAGPTDPVDAGGSVDAGGPAADAGQPDAGVKCPGDPGVPVVISQVYGGGGNASAAYDTDFIELHNRSANPIDVSGWAVEYASAAGSSWGNSLGTLPPNVVIAPGAYELIAVGRQGTSGKPLPWYAIHLSKTIELSTISGKVALVNDTTAMMGSCPSGSALVDFVGYGSANCAAGSPTAMLAPTLSVIRKADAAGQDGCSDSSNNATDFVTGAPFFHGTTKNICSCLNSSSGH